jgi:hypothetical protein
MAFSLHVIMGLGVIPKKHPTRFTSYGFVMTTLNIALEAKLCNIDMPIVPTIWPTQEGNDFIQYMI